MPRVRLTGLFLFITSIVLGLASAATHTTHLRFKKPDRPLVAPESTRPSAPQLPKHSDTLPHPSTLPNSTLPNSTLPNSTLPNSTLPNNTLPNNTLPSAASDREADTLEFISIPMIYPLFSVATAGLLLWFVPAAIFPPQTTPADQRRRRRVRRRNSTGNRKP